MKRNVPDVARATARRVETEVLVAVRTFRKPVCLGDVRERLDHRADVIEVTAALEVLRDKGLVRDVTVNGTKKWEAAGVGSLTRQLSPDERRDLEFAIRPGSRIVDPPARRPAPAAVPPAVVVPPADPTEERRKPGTLRRRLIEVLRGATEPMTSSRVSAESGVDIDRTSASLCAMHQRGVVCRHQVAVDGKVRLAWTLTGAGLKWRDFDISPRRLRLVETPIPNTAPLGADLPVGQVDPAIAAVDVNEGGRQFAAALEGAVAGAAEAIEALPAAAATLLATAGDVEREAQRVAQRVASMYSRPVAPERELVEPFRSMLDPDNQATWAEFERAPFTAEMGAASTAALRGWQPFRSDTLTDKAREVLEAAAHKFPTYEATWSDSVKVAYFRAFDSLLAAIQAFNERALQPTNEGSSV